VRLHLFISDAMFDLNMKSGEPFLLRYLKRVDPVLKENKMDTDYAKYISPAPKGTPIDAGNFIFEVCSNEDDLEEKVFDVIQQQYPEVKQKSDLPFLFLCPAEFLKDVVWD